MQLKDSTKKWIQQNFSPLNKTFKIIRQNWKKKIRIISNNKPLLIIILVIKWIKLYPLIKFNLKEQRLSNISNNYQIKKAIVAVVNFRVLNTLLKLLHKIKITVVNNKWKQKSA